MRPSSCSPLLVMESLPCATVLLFTSLAGMQVMRIGASCWTDCPCWIQGLVQNRSLRPSSRRCTVIEASENARTTRPCSFLVGSLRPNPPGSQSKTGQFQVLHPPAGQPYPCCRTANSGPSHCVFASGGCPFQSKWSFCGGRHTSSSRSALQSMWIWRVSGGHFCSWVALAKLW